MQIFPNDWDLKTKIEFLQRKVLLNSIAYYNFNTNFLSDSEYDSICRQLVELQIEYGDIRDTQYGYVFDDFDGTTGFDLYYRLNEHDSEYLTKMVIRHIHVTKSETGGEKTGRKRRKKKSSRENN